MQRRRLVCWSVSAFVAASSSAALADDLKVPSRYRTIEEAVAAAQPGDRVIVRGGTYENVQVKKDAISILARGATIRGYLWIDGSNVTVTGFRLGPNSHAVVTGDDVTLSGTKASGRGRQSIAVQGGRRARVENSKLASGDIEVLLGEGAVIAENRLQRGIIRAAENGVSIESNSALLIDASADATSIVGNRCRDIVAEGDDCDVSGNSVRMSLTVSGDRATVQSNDAQAFTGHRFQTTPPLVVWGDDALLLANTATFSGIVVSGDGAVIAENEIADSHTGLWLFGERFTVADNTIEVSGIPAFNPGGPGPTDNPAIVIASGSADGAVMDNTLVHRWGPGIQIDGSGMTVSGNDLQGVAAATSIVVTGDGNTVEGNLITHTEADRGFGDGIAVVGDGNAVLDNTIDGVPLDAILVWSGTGNVVDGNDIAAVPGCGIVVTCRAGDTVIADCTVSACRFGIVNEGGSTSLTGTDLTGNEVADILDLSSGFSVFDDNTYETLSHDRVIAPTATLAEAPFPVDPNAPRGD